MQLLVVPLGSVEQAPLQITAHGVKRELGLDFQIAPSLPLDQQAFNQQRRQFLASSFLLPLEKQRPNQHTIVIGVIDADLYVEGLNFVFGLADPHTNVCLIALPRLRHEFYHLPPDKELFHRRILTEAIHELGHCFGLSHCNNPRCVMFFSNSILDTDRKGYHFCPDCRKRILPRLAPQNPELNTSP